MKGLILCKCDLVSSGVVWLARTKGKYKRMGADRIEDMYITDQINDN